MIEIQKGILISEDSLVFKFSRSSGPGGQNVNKLNTKVALFFDVARCDSLSEHQKKRILDHVSTRASKSGVVRVVSQKYRTQKANQRAAVERLGQLLTDALKTKAIRKKTNIPYAAKAQRLEKKRRRSILKEHRKKTKSAEDFVN